jgi:hypothetical protein
LIQAVLQTAAFAFIALSYYFRNRNLRIRRIITFVFILIGLLSILVVFFLSFSTTTMLSVWRPTIGIYMYSINLVILAYIIYNIDITTFSKAKKKDANTLGRSHTIRIYHIDNWSNFMGILGIYRYKYLTSSCQFIIRYWPWIPFYIIA